MQARDAVPVQLLDLGDDEIPLGEEAPDLQLVRLGALAQDAAGEVDGGDGEDGELRGRDVDAPAAGLDLGDAADDEVADLRVVAGAEGPDAEELVGAGEGAREGGGDGGGVGEDVCAVAAGGESAGCSLKLQEVGGRGAYRIHFGSDVMTVPGVRTSVLSSSSWSAMLTSPCRSTPPASESESESAFLRATAELKDGCATGCGLRMVMGMIAYVFCVVMLMPVLSSSLLFEAA